MTKEQILNEAMSLDPRERDEVAEALWQSLVPGELTPGQLAEVRRRIESLENGTAQSIPGDQVMRELHEHYRG